MIGSLFSASITLPEIDAFEFCPYIGLPGAFEFCPYVGLDRKIIRHSKAI
jgi:hypothetical protein